MHLIVGPGSISRLPLQGCVITFAAMPLALRLSIRYALGAKGKGNDATIATVTPLDALSPCKMYLPLHQSQG